MNDAQQPLTEEQIARRRSRARRTALWLLILVLGIYVAFILSGVFGRAA